MKSVFENRTLMRTVRMTFKNCLLLMALVVLLTSCGSSTGTTWQEQYDLGMQYLSDCDYEAAIVAFTAAIEIDPNMTPAYIGRGDSYILSGATEENLALAQMDYEKVLELDETVQEAYLGLSDISILREDYDSALEMLKMGLENAEETEKILERIPDTLQEYYDMALEWLDEENYETAIAILTKIIDFINEMRTDDEALLDLLIDAYVSRGDAYAKSGDTEENLALAMADYLAALELDETAASAYLGIADVYIRQEDYDSVLEILREGLEKAGDPKEIEEKIEEIENGVITDSSGNTHYTPDDIASGSYGDVTWVIDGFGVLTVQGTGEFTDGVEMAPWLEYASDIKKAVIKLSGTENLSWMFSDCINLTEIDMTEFDTSCATNMSGMFCGCWALESLDLSGFDTSNVTDMSVMFSCCESLLDLDLSSFDTGKVTTMSEMFAGPMIDGVSNDTGFETLNLESFDTSNVTDMSYMFFGCVNLTNLDLKNFDTGNVTNMWGMFWDCAGLTELDLSSFDTSNVTSIGTMFYNCNSITCLNLSGFDLTNVIWAENMFKEMTALNQIYTPVNLTAEVYLPDGNWLAENGTQYTALPQNLSYGILLEKGE